MGTVAIVLVIAASLSSLKAQSLYWDAASSLWRLSGDTGTLQTWTSGADGYLP